MQITSANKIRNAPIMSTVFDTLRSQVLLLRPVLLHVTIDTLSMLLLVVVSLLLTHVRLFVFCRFFVDAFLDRAYLFLHCATLAVDTFLYPALNLL